MSCRLFYLFCLCLTFATSISVSVSACPKTSPSYQPTADAIHINNIPVNIYAPSQNDTLVVFHNIDIGREVVIALESAPSTGYSWKWMNKDEPALPSLTYLGCSYNRTEPNGPPGGGGTEYWGFLASRVGPTSIPLTYRRSWEVTDADKHVTIQLHVMSNDTNVTPNQREKIYNHGYTMIPSVILILSLVFLSCCA